MAHRIVSAQKQLRPQTRAKAASAGVESAKEPVSKETHVFALNQIMLLLVR
jgi:hypothetical protein